MNNPKNGNEHLQKFVEGMGVFSELSTMYFKACLKAGATMEEASVMTKIFLELIIHDVNNMQEGRGG